MRAPAKDLEFDLAPPEGHDEPPSAVALHGGAKAQRGTRQEIVFDTTRQTDRLELDLDHAKPASREASQSLGPRAETPATGTRPKTAATQRAAKPGAGALRADPHVSAAPRQDDADSGDGSAPATSAREAALRSQQASGERSGAGPMSRAAVVQPVAIHVRDPRQRQVALLRMCGALLIAASAIWLDSSIAYGNANLVSVLAHALVIYQLGVGVRELWS
jgi:hypothetical protein